MDFHFPAPGGVWPHLEGEPGTITVRAQALISAAAAMEEAATQLDHVKNYSGYTSGAIKALSDRVDDLSSMVRKAQTRYDGAGQALLTYAGKLDAAQKRASAAIATHNNLATTIMNAKQREVDTRINPFDLDTKESDVTDHNNAVNHVKDLEDQDLAAWTEYLAARTDRDHAADHAKHAIEAANDKSDLDDSWWSKVTGALADAWNSIPWKEVLAVLKDVADIVALVATVVGAILVFTGIGAPLGAALLAVGRIASLVSLGISVIRAIRGDVGWGEAIVGGILLALPGVGKVIGRMRGVVPPAGVNAIVGRLGSMNPATAYRTMAAVRSMGRLGALEGNVFMQLGARMIGKRATTEAVKEYGEGILGSFGGSLLDGATGTGSPGIGLPGLKVTVNNHGVEVNDGFESDLLRRRYAARG